MNSTLTFLLGIIVGAVIGGAVALLYAPQSGEELRGRIQNEATAESQRLQAQYEKSMQDVHQRIDKVQSDLHSLRDRSEEQVGPEAETA